MSKFFYPRLAARNLRLNSRFYAPYLLTVAGTSAAFYILSALAFARDLPDQTRYGYLKMFMFIGLFVIGLFSVIFLFYTNSFLLKRRTKELGLYNILGMDKGNITLMLFVETIYTAVIGVGGGILAGMLLQKLVTMLLFRLMSFDASFRSAVSVRAIVVTAILFGVILLLTLARNLGWILRKKPAELLRSGNEGEKEPKTRYIAAVLGVLCLGAGYAIALFTKNAIEALSYYFVAVFLVIIGTYCLFVAVSIAVLKLLRKNKRYYYQTQHFIGVSGMLYRMKRNAVGLANICIMSTMVLVMISGTLSLFLGTEDSMNARYPSPYCAEVRYTPDAEKPFRPDAMREKLLTAINEEGLPMDGAVDYRFFSFSAGWDGSGFVTSPNNSAYSVVGNDLLCVIPAADYEKLTGKTVDLHEGEVLLATDRKKVGDTLTIRFADYKSGEMKGERDYRIAGRIDDFKGLCNFTVYLVDVNYVIVPDDAAYEDLWQEQNIVYGDNASSLSWQIQIEAGGTPEAQSACAVRLGDATRIGADAETTGSWEWYLVDCVADAKREMRALNGGFFFLGVFLGLIFIMATVLIMYYKQASEGYEDRERFQIMQKVGLPKEEIRRSVDRQILVVFFAPLAVAAVHVAFDFRLISMLLTLFQLKNVGLTLICTGVTFLAFAIVYAAVYFLTARVYYKIVK